MCKIFRVENSYLMSKKTLNGRKKTDNGQLLCVHRGKEPLSKKQRFMKDKTGTKTVLWKRTKFHLIETAQNAVAKEKLKSLNINSFAIVLSWMHSPETRFPVAKTTNFFAMMIEKYGCGSSEITCLRREDEEKKDESLFMRLIILLHADTQQRSILDMILLYVKGMRIQR